MHPRRFAKEELLALKVPLPDEETQRRIGSALRAGLNDISQQQRLLLQREQEVAGTAIEMLPSRDDEDVDNDDGNEPASESLPK